MMTREERSNLILAFARVLFINGESTHQTLGAVQRVSNCLGLRATIFPRWGELEVQTEDAYGKFSNSGSSFRRRHGSCGFHFASG